eukprot:2730219-Amphidinium_carterae.1
MKFVSVPLLVLSVVHLYMYLGDEYVSEYDGGTKHRFFQLCPSAAAAVAITGFLLDARWLSTVVSSTSLMLLALGTLAILVSACQDGLRFSEEYLDDSILFGLVGALKAQGGSDRGYIPYCHAWECLMIFGFLLSLRCLCVAPRADAST